VPRARSRRIPGGQNIYEETVQDVYEDYTLKMNFFAAPLSGCDVR
jgi:hypothetical protein